MRWMVVDKNRKSCFPSIRNKHDAEAVAKALNAEGIQELAPYRVVRDAVAEDLG